MKRERNTDSDSFDMLLDAMCNTFGGIIFIALLIALLSNAATSVPEPPPSSEIQSEQPPAVLPEWLKSCESCKKIVLKISKTIADGNNGKKEKADLEKQLQVTVAENAARDATMKELEKQIQDIEIKNNTETISMPIQQKTNKKPVLLAIFNQKFYAISNSSRSSHNGRATGVNRDVVSIFETPAAIVFQLKPGKGQFVNDDILRESLKNIRPDKEYVLIPVAKDSFAEFIKLKKIMKEMKIQYNWGCYIDDKGMFTVSSGEGEVSG